MQNTNYSEKVKDHFLNPRNMGKIKDYDAYAQIGNPICGDVMSIYLKIEKNKQKEYYIKDIKFQTMGCAAAISTSSMITELAKEKTLKEALKITNTSVSENLEGLPPIKMHCSNLAADTLHKAIKDFLNKKDTDTKNACYKCCDIKED